MLAAGAPFGFLYPALIMYRPSAALVAVMGFLCYGSYPLMVSMARQSRGGNLGRRRTRRSSQRADARQFG